MLDDLIYKTINAPVNVNAPHPPPPPSPNPGKGGDLDKRTRKDEPMSPSPEKYSHSSVLAFPRLPVKVYRFLRF